MTIVLTEQEVEIISRALNSVGVTGVDTMKAIIALIDKIEAAKT